MTMPTSNHPQVPEPLVNEREHVRVVDLIELAETDHPFCECGAANGAVVRGDTIWLECATLRQPQPGLRGFVSRLTALHTRRRITEVTGSLPTN